jgi:hypothetical protein
LGAGGGVVKFSHLLLTATNLYIGWSRVHGPLDHRACGRGLLGLQGKSAEFHGLSNFVVEYSKLAKKLDMCLTVNSKNSPSIIPGEKQSVILQRLVCLTVG